MSFFFDDLACSDYTITKVYDQQCSCYHIRLVFSGTTPPTPSCAVQMEVDYLDLDVKAYRVSSLDIDPPWSNLTWIPTGCNYDEKKNAELLTQELENWIENLQTTYAGVLSSCTEDKGDRYNYNCYDDNPTSFATGWSDYYFGGCDNLLSFENSNVSIGNLLRITEVIDMDVYDVEVSATQTHYYYKVKVKYGDLGYESNLIGRSCIPIDDCGHCWDTVYFADHTGTDNDSLRIYNSCCPVPPILPTVDWDDPCLDQLVFIMEANANNRYQAYKRLTRETKFREWRQYILDNVDETFLMEIPDNEYLYTLYYYDQSANLVKTVPPIGVDRLSSSEVATVVSNRGAGTRYVPDHTHATIYEYNSQNQLLWESTPDGGIKKYWYDRLGRITASQNEVQLNDNPTGYVRYSYTIYDALGRIEEAGEARFNSTGLTDAQLQDPAFVVNQSGTKMSWTKTIMTRLLIVSPVLISTTSGTG
jgi:hypothetical protein